MPADLLDYLKGSIMPVCPSGSLPYAPFVIRMGPRCPNVPEHHARMLAGACARNRDLVWGLAISYAREHHLSWTNTIGAMEINEEFVKEPDHGKMPDTKCPLGTNDYPAFILRDGPRCPNDQQHNNSYKPTFVGTNYFDKQGHVLTNLSL
jgi:hypothetical protein